jgi:hypothetical protein
MKNTHSPRYVSLDDRRDVELYRRIRFCLGLISAGSVCLVLAAYHVLTI